METRHFAGRFVQHRLPMFELPVPPEAPVAKRLNLPQGELAQIHCAEEPIRYLAAIELREGSVRGNHYHLAKKCVYLMSGALTVVLEDRETRERLEVEMEAGDRIDTAPGLAHALRITRSGWAVEFAPDPLDSGDTYRYPVI